MERVGTVPEQLGNGPGMAEEQSWNDSGTVQCGPSEQIGDQSEELLQSSELFAVSEFEAIGCNEFKRRYGINNHQFYELRDDLSLDTSKGLSSTMHKAFKILAEKRGWIKPSEVLGETQEPTKPSVNVLPPLSSEPFTAGAMVVASKVDIVPANGYGKRFEFGSQIQEIHFHVHTSNASAYEDQQVAADQSVQNLIDAALEHAEHQGLEDSKEIESIVQAVKSELIKTRVKSAVSGKSVSSDGSNDSVGPSQ